MKHSKLADAGDTSPACFFHKPLFSLCEETTTQVAQVMRQWCPLPKCWFPVESRLIWQEREPTCRDCISCRHGAGLSVSIWHGYGPSCACGNGGTRNIQKKTPNTKTQSMQSLSHFCTTPLIELLLCNEFNGVPTSRFNFQPNPEWQQQPIHRFAMDRTSDHPLKIMANIGKHVTLVTTIKVYDDTLQFQIQSSQIRQGHLTSQQDSHETSWNIMKPAVCVQVTSCLWCRPWFPHRIQLSSHRPQSGTLPLQNMPPTCQTCRSVQRKAGYSISESHFGKFKVSYHVLRTNTLGTKRH